MQATIDAIVLIDRDGRIVDVNAATQHLFGYAPQELIGRNVSCLMPEPFRSEHDDYIKRYLAHGRPRIIGIGREVRAQRRDGSIFPIDLAVGEINDQHGQGFVGFIRDLSSRKRIEARLAAQERELQQQRERVAEAGRLGTLAELASGISHEINQPLAAISTYAQAARRLADDPVSHAQLIQQTLEKISLQADRAGRVIQGMRRLVKHQAAQTRPVQVNRLLRGIEVLLDADSGVDRLRFDLDASDPLVMVDETQIQQVLINLVRNAIEAAPDGQVELRSACQDHAWVAVSVLDQGPGLPADIAQRIFEPFVTGRPEGLGLGLSISQSIVEAHGGELRVHARDAGGCCFTVLLPRVRGDA